MDELIAILKTGLKHLIVAYITIYILFAIFMYSIDIFTNKKICDIIFNITRFIWKVFILSMLVLSIYVVLLTIIYIINLILPYII